MLEQNLTKPMILMFYKDGRKIIYLGKDYRHQRNL